LEAPNHKQQAPNKSKTPNENARNEKSRSLIGLFAFVIAEFRSFELRAFGFVCDLVLGAWSFRPQPKLDYSSVSP
jgi:hypothetical protein